MKKRAGGSKAKAKGRKAPAARAPRVAKPAAAGLRAIKGARHHELGSACTGMWDS